MPLTLPPLPYPYDALAPFMSVETLKLHHDRHHQAYIDKANELLTGTGLEEKSIEQQMLVTWKDKGKSQILFNNLGQHYNHTLFWQWMKKGGGGKRVPTLLENKLRKDIGTFDEFRKKFIEAGMTQFGSGWCWLAMENRDGKLEIMKTANGENPVVQGYTPLLGCDVWEHAYYIDYRNSRQTYLETWFDNLVNWEFVAQLFEKGPLKLAA